MPLKQFHVVHQSVAVHFLKLALHDCEELIMKEIWTLSNSRKMFSGV